MVNKIMYQKIQYFKRRGFTKADIVRETGLNKRTVWLEILLHVREEILSLSRKSKVSDQDI